MSFGLGTVSGQSKDTFTVWARGSNIYNVVIDHCEMYFSKDENFSIVGTADQASGPKYGCHDVTSSHNLMAAPLSSHDFNHFIKYQTDNVTLYCNAMLNGSQRNPNMNASGEIINNYILYNGGRGVTLDESNINVIGNYVEVGSSGKSDNAYMGITGQGNVGGKLYVQDNVHTGTNVSDPWDIFSGNLDESKRTFTKHSYPTSKILPSGNVRNSALDNAGNNFHNNSLRQRVIGDARNGIGNTDISSPSQLGGWPSISMGSPYADSDGDGMENQWEIDNGLNPNNDDSSGDLDGDGYTNIEEFLECLVDPNCDTSSPPVNNPPTISSIGDQSIDQDQTLGPINFTVGDAESSSGSLTVTASSNDQSLVNNSDISLGGSGANRNITVTPVSGEFGTVSITITVSDGTDQTTESFILTVNEVIAGNTPPTISGIPNQSIMSNEVLGPVDFTIGDAETSAGNLTLSTSSNNQQLVPNNNITLSGNGSNRQITVTPANGQLGTASITITVSDGTDSANESFNLTVSNNGAPTISNIANQTTDQDVATGPIDFTVGDAETPVNQLTVTAKSSDLALVPVSNITFGGSGANRNVDINPAPGRFGTTTITLTVNDGSNTTSESFVLTVLEDNPPINTPPTITSINNQSIQEGSTLGPLAFTVGDADSAPGSLQVTASSDSQQLVPNNGIVITGNGASKQITVTPAAGETGTCTVTIAVSDGTDTTTETFTLNVNQNNPTTSEAWIEAECATIGANWSVVDDGSASGGSYLMIPSGNNLDNPPTDPSSMLIYTVSLSESGNYKMFCRVNAPNTEDDSFWVRVNGDPWIKWNEIPKSNGFNWQQVHDNRNGNALVTFNLASGINTIEIAHREDGTGLDKIYVTNTGNAPTGTGGAADNCNTGNTSPTISNIGNHTIDENEILGPIDFNIGDNETDANDLTVSAKSNNQTLVPDSNIKISGNGANRGIEITPAASQTGKATITVTVDDGSSTASESFDLTVTGDPTGPITVSLDVEDITCNNGNDGSITAIVSGGTQPYTYEWSNNSNSSTITNLAEGDYSVLVTDANGATTQVSGHVSKPEDITVSSEITNVGCAGNNGAVELFVSGGSSGVYTYQWSNGALTKDISNLGAGIYEVTISDANGCQKDFSFQVLANDESIEVSGIVSNTSCSGGDGSISLTVTGGAGDYQYSWSNGATTKDVSGLDEGIYTVSITDAGGCTTDKSFEVEDEQSSFIFSVNIKDANCGAEDGAIDLSVSGDDGSYEYRWSNGANTANISNLAPGTYEVNIQSPNGCRRSASFVVPAIVGPGSFDVQSVVVDASCSGDYGSIELIPDDNGPYEYDWSNGASTQNIDNLVPGTYEVTITQSSGCYVIQTFVINSNSGPEKPTISQNANELTTNSAADYQWYLNGDAIDGANDQSYTAEDRGSYSVEVFDSNGCSVMSDELDVVVEVPCTGNVSYIDTYPIPARDVLNIDVGMCSPNLVGFGIFTLDGRPMMKKNLGRKSDNVSHKFDVSKLRPGVYLIKVKAGNEVVVRRFIVN